MHSTITNSSNLFASQSFATHALYVTKHHDNEQSCSHSTNSYDPRNPVVDFSKYFDSEDLIQEDLVLWYNLGVSLLSHSETRARSKPIARDPLRGSHRAQTDLLPTSKRCTTFLTQATFPTRSIPQQ